MALGRIKEVFRRKGDASQPGWTHIQPLFEVLFWMLFVASFAVYLYDDGERFGLLPVSLAFVALGVVWTLLPREREVPTWRKLWSLALLVTVFIVGHLTGSVLFYFVATVNGVYVFGLRKGFAYGVVALGLLCTQIVLSEPSARPEELLGDALLLWGPAFLFVIGMSTAAVEADRRNREARDLLAELEEAHLELGRYAARVRELSVYEERTRVAREIHDSLGHHLTVAGLHLEASQKLIQQEPEEAESQLGRARTSFEGALSEARRSVRALKPLAVEEGSGSGALRALARGFEGVGPKVSFEVAGEERELPQGVELIHYRVLQEGLTNALKHAGAGRVRAQLTYAPKKVLLSVSDDGAGIPKYARVCPTTQGFGLKALRERVEDVGGSLSTGNAPDGGFRLEAELPTVSPSGREIR